jgi:predicted SnoaL-like aldol condensation-catalyzing enzyme
MVNSNKYFKRWTHRCHYPSEYKQHNPFAEQGRDFAIQVLSNGFAEGNMPGNLTVFGGQGYGMMHYRVDVPLTGKAFAIADYFKFRGGCIVEHWDVLQEITGNEPNPIAYF